MKFNELKATAHKRPNRVGRGISHGQGKTAGRGTKGQNSRAGGGVRLGFEGGQNPLMRRLPKLRGFTSHRTPKTVVYTGQLELIKGAIVDNYTLSEAGLVESPYASVKLVLNGELKQKKTIKLQAASEGAIKTVKKAGGSFTKIDQIGREAKKPKTKAR